MINIVKHAEFFNPMKVEDPVHIIGCGAIGSHIAEQLARLGIDRFMLYDFDTVDPPNIANQMYTQVDVGRSKVMALAGVITAINPEAAVLTHSKGWRKEDRPLRGYVFLCVDSVAVRRDILIANKMNPMIKAFFDCRMRLSDAQHYACEGGADNVEALLKTMDFTEEEAQEATPVSACGTTLSIIPTVKIITACAVANFINNVKGLPLKKLILIDAFDFQIDAM